ncbi:hypothetical protein H6G81_28495 [Scytonema hofmannii FACHB-248]|uniref:Uncharacterized protein n=1 Tax=Scytonema hofmannii FACHB-248 TaxID=1842502 RepID=A0ABR8GYX5_9CYAN|nr:MULTISPECIES: hypothetical protein [Nostocales]MBD2608352.1 hypothetical protein [Scytonema hofmannii FACHB-248]
MALSDNLLNPNKKNIIVDDCTKLLDTQVANMGGVSGLGLKAAYSVVKGIRPTYCNDAIEGLLPQSLNALDPIWSEGIQIGDPVGHLTQNRDRAANALLAITDAKIEKSNNTIVRGAYSKLRNSAKKHVEDAIPGLAKIIDNHTKN